MDLHRLNVFAKVFELKSISRTAEAVLLSQPTVSGHIKTLESELGVRLFDRLGRGVTPTPTANVLYDYALQLLTLRDKALVAVAASAGLAAGPLTVAASTIPGSYLLPGCLAQLRKTCPDLKPSIEISSTAEVVRQVESGRAEVGFVGARISDARLNYNEIYRDKLILCCRSDVAEGPTEPKKLARLPLILREPGSGTRMSAAAALKKVGLNLADMNIIAVLGSSEAIRQAALTGLGATFISRLAVDSDLEQGRLVEVTIDELDLERPIFTVVREGATLSPGAVELIETVKRQLGESNVG